MKLSVPYYSQYLDIQDSFWMLRSCGGLCLKMVVEYHGKVFPDFISFCNEAKDVGGYHLQNGWVHDYLVAKAEGFGLQAYRKEGLTSLDEVISSLEAGNPVIISVEKRVLEQTRFHMIILTGFESVTAHTQQPTTYFYYHETESTDKEKGQFRKCDRETLMHYWRGKAIFITKAD